MMVLSITNSHTSPLSQWAKPMGMREHCKPFTEVTV